jgi:hypothetical protein
MSPPAIHSKSGSSFFWVLAAFASFAVLFLIIQTLAAKPGAEDPRAPERTANTAEIVKAQSELTAKMGLNDLAKKSAIFDKTLTVLSSRKPTTSTQVVPGSPTQIKQAAAPAATTPAPAAPATATPATK